MRWLASVRPHLLATAIVAAMLAGVAAGLVFAGAFLDDDGDRTIEPIAVAGTSGDAAAASRARARRPTTIVVEDGIGDGDARRAVAAAENDVGGVALTVDRDGRRYEVELQRPDGTIVEVLVDERFGVLGIDGDR